MQLNFSVEVGRTMLYIEDAMQIRKAFVPKSGPADRVQGELLRVIERLRWKSQYNGNVSWDEDFARYCLFLEQTLVVTPLFNEQLLEEIRATITRLRDLDYPYLEDALFDRLSDRTVEDHRFPGKPVARERDRLQHR